MSREQRWGSAAGRGVVVVWVVPVPYDEFMFFDCIDFCGVNVLVVGLFD